MSSKFNRAISIQISANLQVKQFTKSSSQSLRKSNKITRKQTNKIERKTFYTISPSTFPKENCVASLKKNKNFTRRKNYKIK